MRPRDLEAEFMGRLQAYFTMACALVAFGVLIWLILAIRKWFVDSDDSDEPFDEMLTQFRQLKQEGELSEEEYRLIRERLSAGKNVRPGVGKQADLPAKPVSPDPEQPPDVPGDEPAN